MSPEIASLRDIKALEAQVIAAAERAATEIRATGGSGIEFLRRLKFEECGRHPVKDQPLNLIEQVNQTFTYLVTFRAAELLLAMHPDVGPLRLNIGTASGTDVEDLDRKFVAAEVFAAVHPRSNRKLAKDIDRVRAIDVPHRYVFFAAPGYAGRQPSLERPGVQVWAVELFAAAPAAPEGTPLEEVEADPDAMQIRTAWALRFDGWGYVQTVGLDYNAAIDRYIGHGKISEDPLHQLAVFFMMQRWLGKFGGENELPDGAAHRQFRELFLKTYAVEVPERYRFGHRYADWERVWLPRTDKCVAEVRRMHDVFKAKEST